MRWRFISLFKLGSSCGWGLMTGNNLDSKLWESSQSKNLSYCLFPKWFNKHQCVYVICPHAACLDWIWKASNPLDMCASCPHPPWACSACLQSRVRQQTYLSWSLLGFVCHPLLNGQVISWWNSLYTELENTEQVWEGKTSSKPVWPLPRVFDLEGTLSVFTHGLSSSYIVLRFCLPEGIYNVLLYAWVSLGRLEQS